MIAGSLLWGGGVLLLFLLSTLFFSWFFSPLIVTGKYLALDEPDDDSCATWDIFRHNARVMAFMYVPALLMAILISFYREGETVLETVILLPLLLPTAWMTLRSLRAHTVALARSLTLNFLATKQMGVEWLFWVSMVPHGIIELPAVFLIAGHSLWLVKFACFASLPAVISGIWILGSAVMVAGCALLLPIAAWVEANITCPITKQMVRRHIEGERWRSTEI